MLREDKGNLKVDERLLMNSLRLLFVISVFLSTVVALSYYHKIAFQTGYAITSKINVNTASVDTLSLLPGIGPKTAAKIVAYRQLHPNNKKTFAKPNDLTKINGLGKAKIERITPFICFE